MVDQVVERFVQNLAIQNKGSAKTVRNYLNDFGEFCNDTFKLTVSELVKKLKEGTFNDEPKEEQVYSMFKSYAYWLNQNRLENEENSARTVRLKMSWARTLLESSFVNVNRTIFKQQVKLPRQEEPDITPTNKETLKTTIEKCEDVKMQTYLLFLGCMGWRPKEALSIRPMDLEHFNINTLKFDKLPAYVNVSGKHAKTKKGKRRRLSDEMVKQFEYYFAHKYRPRVIKRYDENNKVKTLKVNPVPKAQDLVFADFREGKTERSKDTLNHMYKNFANRFADHVERLGVGLEENGKRHKVTLHTFRRFVFKTCSKAVSEQYAKHHIGRKVHEYAGKTEEEISEEYEQVEPYLTYLDTRAVELRQKAIQKQVEEVQAENKILKGTLPLMIRFMQSTDPKEKAEISRELLELGYMPKG